MLMALLANVHRDPSTPPQSAADFMVLARNRAPVPSADRPAMSEAERVRAQLMQGGG